MNTKELYKKGFDDLNNHDGMVTHTEPDILECGVRLALGNMMMNKAIGGYGLSDEVFKFLN